MISRPTRTPYRSSSADTGHGSTDRDQQEEDERHDQQPGIVYLSITLMYPPAQVGCIPSQPQGTAVHPTTIHHTASTPNIDNFPGQRELLRHS